MTPQKKMQATLEKTGIPYKRVHCYGSQIVVTAWSRDAAMDWARLLEGFSQVSDIIKTLDETQDSPRKYHDVYRVFATV